MDDKRQTVEAQSARSGLRFSPAPEVYRQSDGRGEIGIGMTDEPLCIGIGCDSNGRPKHFDLSARPPSRRLFDRQPTREMIVAFERFYGLPVGRLRRSQVVAMIAYASFGLAFVRTLPAQIASSPIFFSRLVAAFVASNGAIARDIVSRYVDQGDFGLQSYRVEELAYCEVIARMCREACAALSDEGIAPTALSGVSMGKNPLVVQS